MSLITDRSKRAPSPVYIAGADCVGGCLQRILAGEARGYLRASFCKGREDCSTTIEELAAAIRNGQTDRYEELWENVRTFVAYRAAVRYQSVQDKSGVDIEDLIQAGFLGLVEAVNSYDQGCGYSFLTHLGYHLKSAFNEACGVRWNRIARDPIHSARSLDMPIDAEDPEGPTLGDYLPSSCDVAAEAEERVYNEQLHEALEKLLSRLAPDAAELIRQSYFGPMGSKELAAHYGLTEKKLSARKAENMMRLRTLARQTPEGANLRRFIDENTNFFFRVSPRSFNTTHTSATELLTMHREKLTQIMTRKEFMTEDRR